MKRLRIIELSANEQRVVLIIIFILITISFVAYERRVRHSPVESALSTQPKPSPTVLETIGDR
jgi:uncharacterized ion transporter superfamily protein YfcC